MNSIGNSKGLAFQCTYSCTLKEIRVMFNHIWSKATALASSGVMLALTSSYAAASSAVLKPDDFVGISFWLISMALIEVAPFV